MSPRLVWYVQPHILLVGETYPEEVLREGLMRPMSRDQWEYLEERERQAEWDKKHPRCEECGQFLKKKPKRAGLDFGLDESEWVSHYYRSSYEYNEWDHI